MTGWIVIAGRNAQSQGGFRRAWWSDMEPHGTDKAAIRHGLATIRPVDFRVGYVQEGVLQKLQYMEETPRFWDELADVAQQLGILSRMAPRGGA